MPCNSYLTVSTSTTNQRKNIISRGEAKEGVREVETHLSPGPHMKFSKNDENVKSHIAANLGLLK